MVRVSQIAVLILLAGFSTEASELEIKKQYGGIEEKAAPRILTKNFFSTKDLILRIVQTSSNHNLRSERRNCVFCHSGSEKI
ncbi:hypothetical protein JWG45_03150 [Leptospira sp. 201903070]|uniref:Cytochrome c domain-containing protein n=1 Tax=Leptospira ainlahdjerensis TaxID=2810033 RepID=A0ABS2U700_9LEPT|nr:hypothetical protein [Leptospira ainlahdjerensis]MBM9576141.1 hypothetical protein [Leptospira ainlahdjerensis]